MTQYCFFIIICTDCDYPLPATKDMLTEYFIYIRLFTIIYIPKTLTYIDWVVYNLDMIVKGILAFVYAKLDWKH